MLRKLRLRQKDGCLIKKNLYLTSAKTINLSTNFAFVYFVYFAYFAFVYLITDLEH